MSLHNYWYIAATSAAVKKRPQCVQLFGTHYVVFHRGGGGVFAALQDRCPHRNAPLSAGKVCDGQIQCPYHGWRFDGDGRLAAIPALTAQALPAIRVPALHCMEQDGYVWLCPGTPATDTPLRFAHLGEPGWTSFRMRTRFAAPVAQCLENFLDCPHAVYVHESWFRAPTGRAVRATVRHLADGAEIEYRNEPRERSWVWRLLQDSNTDMRHTDRFIAPATSRVDYRFSDHKHYIITSSCTPLNDNETEVHTVISFKYGRIGPLVRLVFEPLSRLIIRQDVDIMAKQRANIRRFGGTERFYMSDADLLMPAILAWREALEQGATPPAAGLIREQGLFL
ncbi:phenylpropionate dioxygenase-like ring-hydroxylating dioxygenase large terminal subunit [Neisseria sp. HSC-16F19]|nr:Rieske 2Fe-2S domain-containing protein [Neisseria sp. HSC-16F19]MCP2041598.1 phenylpropionate dioxygenase-like ring-hydroxylating dioxygenase large terminal subunit [Neisseria sp. HSC-16F19]